MLNIIVAVDKHNAIGKNGTLPWHCPGDLKQFKEHTLGQVVIMGRKTFESLPGQRPLPNRINIVISSTPEKYDIPGTTFVSSITDAIDYATLNFGDRIAFIIGGGSIYEQSINMVDGLFLSTIDVEVENPDTYFCDIPSNFHKMHESDHDGFKFELYLQKFE